MTNVQTETSYPRTGEYHSSYLIFSGICLLLILLILSMKRDIKN
ncbi:MAG: LPXTG cell wall anchor domain-containing protein [Enterococcus malodoratus]